MNDVAVSITRLPHGSDLDLPAYQSEGAAGMDLFAAIDDATTLDPGEHRLLPTGISIALPLGYEAQVRPRSGLALKHALTVVNAPGTIDADYRGEIGVILINLGKEPVTIRPKSRIAQLVVAPVSRVVWDETASLDASVRGGAGFGSTGTEG